MGLLFVSQTFREFRLSQQQVQELKIGGEKHKLVD